MLSENQQKEFTILLNNRLTKNRPEFSCPMCGEKNFSLLNEVLRTDVQEELERAVMKGRGVPTLAIICTNCGFLSQHVLGTLGLLGKDQPVPLAKESAPEPTPASKAPQVEPAKDLEKV